MSTTVGHSTESLNPSCSLTVQLVIGSLVLPDQCVCAPVSCCSAPHAGEIQEFNDGLEIGRQVIVEFYEFCWVYEALTNITRLIQQLDMRLVNYIPRYSGEWKYFLQRRQLTINTAVGCSFFLPLRTFSS